MVSAGDRRVEFSPEQPDNDAQMNSAMAAAVRVLEALSETPVAAVGINIDLVINPFPDGFFDSTLSEIDQRFQESEEQLAGRSLKWSLTEEGGTLNIGLLDSLDNTGSVSFNYERRGLQKPEFIEWLNRPFDGFKDRATQVLANYFQLR